MKKWAEKIKANQIDVLFASAVRRGMLRQKMDNSTGDRRKLYTEHYEFERGFEKGYLLALKMMEAITINEYDDVMGVIIEIATEVESLDYTDLNNEKRLRECFIK